MKNDRFKTTDFPEPLNEGGCGRAPGDSHVLTRSTVRD